MVNVMVRCNVLMGKSSEVSARTSVLYLLRLCAVFLQFSSIKGLAMRRCGRYGRYRRRSVLPSLVPSRVARHVGRRLREVQGIEARAP